MERLQKRHSRALWVLAMVTCTFAYAACSEPTAVAPPPNTLPVTPPNPAVAPSVITSVADVNNGQVPANTRVLVYGQLTTQAGDDDEWNFDDGSGAIVLDFPNNNVPTPGVNVLVLGSVDDDDGRREIDVEAWAAETTKPPEPVDPPDKGIDPTPPPLVITPVRDINNGDVTGEVILAGRLTERAQEGDCDEWFFTDGNGTVELDFSSCHVPMLNTPVYILGKVDSRTEVDVNDWALQ